MVAHANLATSHRDFDFTISSRNQIPADATGFLFPFVLELANPDYSTPIAVVSRYLKGALGDTDEEALEAFDRLRANWSILAITMWGAELAHMFWCLGITLASGGTLRVITSSADRYAGCMLLGNHFTISIRGAQLLRPANREALVLDFGSASPHDGAMVAIFSKIFFASMEDRAAARVACQSIHDLRAVLARQGTVETGRALIERLALHLEFPGHIPSLPPTGHNISRVLDCVANENQPESEFPLYPPFVLEESRAARLWSAFGSTAPSFRVPGGKTMQLGKAFEVVERDNKGARNARSVKKIGVILKPLKEAIQDLEIVRTEGTVLNPYGSGIMARSSAQTLVKTLEGDQCERVLASLRRYAKVTVTEESGASGSKRKARDDGEKGKKKRRADDL